MSTAKAILFLLYLAFLLRQGFGRRPRFASWHMFAGCRQCTFRLAQGDARTGAELNPWLHLPHTQLQIGPEEADLFLLYLRRVHGLENLTGVIELRDGFRVSRLAVANSRVVS
jgi:hypothetical protein